MLHHNRNSAFPQSQFSAVRNFKSATWELQFCNFQHIFGREIQSIHEKKFWGQKSRATVPLRQVFDIQRNRQFKEYFWLIFKTILIWRKGTRMAGDCGEMRKCGSQILKVRNRRSAIAVPQLFKVCNFAIDLVVRNIAVLRSCGLYCGCPPLQISWKYMQCLRLPFSPNCAKHYKRISMFCSANIL